MLEYITEITILIIEIICYFTFFDIFAIKRKRNKREVILAFLVLIFLTRLCILFLREYTIIKMLIMIVIILLIMWFLYDISAVKTLILVFFVESIISTIDYIVVMILTKLYGDITVLEGASGLVGRLIIILSRLILFAVLIIISRISAKKRNTALS